MVSLQDYKLIVNAMLSYQGNRNLAKTQRNYKPKAKCLDGQSILTIYNLVKHCKC